MRHADLVDYWKRWNRLRATTKGWFFLGPLGIAAVGIAGGAWAGGKPFASLWVAGLGAVGVALLVGAWLTRHQNTDSLEAICCDYEDFLVRWKGEEENPDFVLLEGSIATRRQRMDRGPGQRVAAAWRDLHG